VFQDVPANSSLQFEFILPFDSFRDIMGMNAAGINWDNPAPFETYVLLEEYADHPTDNPSNLDRYRLGCDTDACRCAARSDNPSPDSAADT